MSKKLLISFIFGLAALGVIAARSRTPDPGFHFLNGSKLIGANVIDSPIHGQVEVERFAIHEPFDQAWGEAEAELTSSGWKLGVCTDSIQKFRPHNNVVVSLMRGGVDKNQIPVEGTDQTDTYVIVERFERS